MDISHKLRNFYMVNLSLPMLFEALTFVSVGIAVCEVTKLSKCASLAPN